MPVVPHGLLRDFVVTLLAKSGARRADAQIVADHLVDANLAGHDSHGLIRVAQYVAAIRSGQLSVTSSPRIVAEFPTGAVIDGACGFGQVVARQAVDRAIDRARAGGVAAISVRNCYHTGRIGSYTEQVAAQNMVGIAMVNAGGGGQTVAPFGGLSRRLATNPISIAAPSGGAFPLVLDIATSVAPEGKLRSYDQQRKPVPEGWIVDARGRPTTNAAEFYEPPGGALLPLGGSAGYKGFGLAIMIDVLAGALSGGGCCREEVVDARDSLLLIVLDVARFGSPTVFHQHVRDLIEHVKSSRTAPGIDEIMVPGEPEFRQRRERQLEGISLDESTWRPLVQLAIELDVTVPRVDGVALESIARPNNGERPAAPSHTSLRTSH